MTGDELQYFYYKFVGYYKANKEYLEELKQGLPELKENCKNFKNTILSDNYNKELKNRKESIQRLTYEVNFMERLITEYGRKEDLV